MRMDPLASDQIEPNAAVDPLATVIRYHQETKHHFFRYARALGYMDWANQPDPFRRYEGAPLLRLPLVPAQDAPLSPAYAALYEPGRIAPQPVSMHTVSRFLEFALALSAWKQVGEVRWALRSNPSSGNLHPTEGYLLIGPITGLAETPALYHYAPREHALEVRARYDPEPFTRLMRPFPPQAFLFGLTSVHWRESWKYGERAFRYCQHDAGHAIGAARIAAATLGWKLVLLEDLSDDQVQCLLGTNRREDFVEAEAEHPDCLVVVWPTQVATDSTLESGTLPLSLESEPIDTLTRSPWFGRANRLGRDNPVPWEIIDEVAEASWKGSVARRVLELEPPVAADHQRSPVHGESPAGDPGDASAGQIIRQRRSAVALDGETSISAARFFTMMARVMPHGGSPVLRRPMPWDAITWAARIHLALFVHRVDGLAAGLYFLVRDPSKVSVLQASLHSDFLWQSVPGSPPGVPLFLLQEGDARRLAVQVSCHQDIAGDSAFSLGMIADFEASLHSEGPWFYRRLFWESGIVGQVLYLEAEAAGVRATGIGCFFDDPVHQALGVKDLQFQSLYHFTTGGAVDDHRLTTLPPYGHLSGQ